MILVNICRLSQTIPLQSGEKVWESSLFFHVNTTLSGCFQGNTFAKWGIKQQKQQKKKLYWFPEPLLDVRSQTPTP